MTTTGSFLAAAQASDADRTRFTDYTENHPASDEVPALWDAVFGVSNAPFDPNPLIVLDVPADDSQDIELSMTGTPARLSLLRHQPGAYSIVTADKNLEMRKINVGTEPGADQQQVMVLFSWAIENCPADRWEELNTLLAHTWDYVATGIRERSIERSATLDPSAGLPPPART